MAREGYHVSTLRVPRDLWYSVAALAHHHNRKTNAEIITALEQYVEAVYYAAGGDKALGAPKAERALNAGAQDAGRHADGPVHGAA